MFLFTNTSSSKDLRANCDENLYTVFESLGYKESFSIVDVKLGLGVILALLAGGAYYLDKKTKFNESFPYMVILVGLYFPISGLLWAWTKFVEKNIKFVGYNANGTKVVVSTSSENEFYLYTLKVGDAKEVEHKTEFTKLFNKNGFLDYEEFKKTLIADLKKITKKDH